MNQAVDPSSLSAKPLNRDGFVSDETKQASNHAFLPNYQPSMPPAVITFRIITPQTHRPRTQPPASHRHVLERDARKAIGVYVPLVHQKKRRVGKRKDV